MIAASTFHAHFFVTVFALVFVSGGRCSQFSGAVIALIYPAASTNGAILVPLVFALFRIMNAVV